MQKIMLVIFCCILMTVTSAFATRVDDAIKILSSDLQKQCVQKSVLKIGVADFISPQYMQSGFVGYLTTSFIKIFSDSTSKIMVTDQQAVEAVLFKTKILLN